MIVKILFLILKKAGFINDTHRRNTHSNKTQALTKSVNMDISVVGIFNELFVKGFYTQKFVAKLRFL